MKTYVGTEQVSAVPMTRGEYVEYRGWTLPANESPSDAGYFIQRPNGHVNWLPIDTFEEIYEEPIDNTVKMVDVKHDLHTTKYTAVSHEEEFQFNAPHLFHVRSMHHPEGKNLLAIVHFQEGPIKENGVNGVCNEDLIHMVISRLEHFQKSEYSNRDNQIAIGKLEEALLWLRKRTIGRENRGVEGTSVK